MSRSYRKPYATITGFSSAQQDKTIAARAVRRSQNVYVRRVRSGHLEWDAAPVPHRYECNHNDVWGWVRDGKQRLVRLRHNDFNPFYLVSAFDRRTEEDLLKDRNERLDWKVRWVVETSRK